MVIRILFYILLFTVCGSNIALAKGNLDRNLLPQPVYSEKPEFVDLYWNTWELAWGR